MTTDASMPASPFQRGSCVVFRVLFVMDAASSVNNLAQPQTPGNEDMPKPRSGEFAPASDAAAVGWSERVGYHIKINWWGEKTPDS
jgi:hypothetical protein